MSEEVDWCYRFRQAGWKVLFYPGRRGRSTSSAPRSTRGSSRRSCAATCSSCASTAGEREAERARRVMLWGLRLRGLVLPRRAGPRLPRGGAVARVGQHRSAPRIGPVKALVVDVGWVNGLAAIRSLGRAGIAVLAVDHRPSPLGFRSRYAQPVTRARPGWQTRTGFVAAVAKIGGPAVVFPTHDPPLNALARNARSARRLSLPVPRLEVPRVDPGQAPPARDRRAARTSTSPRRSIRTTARPEAPPRSSAFPSSSSRSIPTASSAGSASRRSAARRLPSSTRLRGRGAVRADGAGARPGRRRRALQLRQLPARGRRGARALLRAQAEADAAGRSARAASARRSGCRRSSTRACGFCGRSGFHGISQVEFKRDPRDGRFKLMEVNPRLWQWHGLAAACGVDLPLIAYRDLTGERVEPVSMNGARRTWSITLMPGERPAVPAAARTWTPSSRGTTSSPGSSTPRGSCEASSGDSRARSSGGRAGCSTRSARGRSASATTFRTAPRRGSRSSAASGRRATTSRRRSSTSPASRSGTGRATSTTASGRRRPASTRSTRRSSGCGPQARRRAPALGRRAVSPSR